MAPPIVPQSHINRVSKILDEIYEFQGTPQERGGFINNAGLRGFVSGLNLNGPPRVVAGSLLNRLNTHGFLVERPAYHALGQLFAYLIEMSDIGIEDRKYIAELIVQYGLVRDSLYIETLHTTYDLTVTPVATPPPGAPAGPIIAPPSLPGDFPTAPPFKAQIDDPVSLERVLNSEDNFLDLHVLLGAIYSARAVARIEVPEGTPKGTGFLIAPDLLLTNQHVLKDASLVGDTTIRFGYLKDLLTVPLEGQVFKLVPGFYYASPENELDYALVKVDGEPLKDIRFTGKLGEKTTLELIRENTHRGYLQLAGRTIQNLDRVNIIQHPKGNPLKVVLTQNYVTASMSATRVHYLADTDYGSSGSPVFNERWEVVALHHGSKQTQLKTAEGQKRISYENEGIPIRAILEDFKARNLLKFLPEYR